MGFMCIQLRRRLEGSRMLCAQLIAAKVERSVTKRAVDECIIGAVLMLDSEISPKKLLQLIETSLIYRTY